MLDSGKTYKLLSSNPDYQISLHKANLTQVLMSLSSSSSASPLAALNNNPGPVLHPYMKHDERVITALASLAVLHLLPVPPWTSAELYDDTESVYCGVQNYAFGKSFAVVKVSSSISTDNYQYGCIHHGERQNTCRVVTPNPIHDDMDDLRAGKQR